MSTSTGIFTTPKNGTYAFAFSCTKMTTTTATKVSLRLNGSNVATTDLGNTAAYDSGSINAILKLKKGDQVILFLVSGILYDTTEYRTQFSGILLEEDLVIS